MFRMKVSERFGPWPPSVVGSYRGYNRLGNGNRRITHAAVVGESSKPQPPTVMIKLGAWSAAVPVSSSAEAASFADFVRQHIGKTLQELGHLDFPDLTTDEEGGT